VLTKNATTGGGNPEMFGRIAKKYSAVFSRNIVHVSCLLLLLTHGFFSRKTYQHLVYYQI
jgi:hypothetical protein